MPPAYVVTVVATATHAYRLVNIWMHKFDLITSEQYSLSDSNDAITVSDLSAA